MSKLINSKAFWSCIIAVLAIVFCVQLGMQFRGDPDEAVTRQLEQEIQQVTAENTGSAIPSRFATTPTRNWRPCIPAKTATNTSPHLRIEEQSMPRHPAFHAIGVDKLS